MARTTTEEVASIFERLAQTINATQIAGGSRLIIAAIGVDRETGMPIAGGLSSDERELWDRAQAVVQVGVNRDGAAMIARDLRLAAASRASVPGPFDAEAFGKLSSAEQGEWLRSAGLRGLVALVATGGTLSACYNAEAVHPGTVVVELGRILAAAVELAVSSAARIAEATGMPKGDVWHDIQVVASNQAPAEESQSFIRNINPSVVDEQLRRIKPPDQGDHAHGQ